MSLAGAVQSLTRLRSMLVLVLATLVVSAVGVVWTAHRIRTLTTELEALQAEHDAGLVERGRLLLEHSAFAGLTRVETLASEKLGMKIPSQAEMEIVRER